MENGTPEETPRLADDNLRLDYEQTCLQIRTLTDVRFKLLAFVPTLTGIAVSLVNKPGNAGTALAVGLLGFVVTFGIIIYELRNTTFYDAALHRAKWLEVQLSLPVLTEKNRAEGQSKGGLFTERPSREGLPKLLNSFELWHDFGLALVYGASLGGWTYVISYSALRLFDQAIPVISLAMSSLVSILVAGLVAIWYINSVLNFLNRMERPQATQAMVDKLHSRG
jgi:hypothetical protein